MYLNIDNTNMYYLFHNNECMYLGDKEDLIEYLVAHWRRSYILLADKLHSGVFEGAYKWHNVVFENYSMEMGDSSKYVITDGLHRIINIDNYYEQTFRLAKEYLEEICKVAREEKDKDNSFTYPKNHSKYGIYRCTPVPNTRKYRGGPSQKVRKTARIYKLYADPEQKEYNRGSCRGIPSWWDDFSFRRPQKSWKEQSKRSHQWKEK